MRRSWESVKTHWLAFVPVLMACGDAAYGGPRPEAPAAPSRTYPSMGGGAVASSTITPPAPPPSPASGVDPASSPSQGAVGALERPLALHHFFEALEALETGAAAQPAPGREDVHVVQFGDSHTAADYETGPLRRALQARFGDGGRGFVSLGKPWRYYVQEGVHMDGMSGWSPERGRYERGRFVGDGLYGPVGVAITSSQRGARAWTDLAARATRLEVAYLEQPQGGSVDVLVDGVRVQRIGTRAATPAAAYATLEVTDQPHHVELQPAGDGPVRVFGMALDRPQAGVTLDAFGVNGARVVNMLTWDEAHFAEQLRHRSADLVVLAFGTNESADDTPMDVYERQMVDVLGRVARAVPAASCLLLGPPDRAKREGGVWSTVPRLLDIVASQRRVAEAAGCAYYSQLDAMGGPGSIAAWATESPPRAMLDRTHLSREGYAQLGDAVARDLVAAYEAWREVHGKPLLPGLPPRRTEGAEPVARGR
jgi:lysophospholipase L1-like esterase